MRWKKYKIISSSFDKRDKDPNKNYGISPERVYYAFVGPDGAVSTKVATDKFLPPLKEELGDSLSNNYPYQSGFSYHWKSNKGRKYLQKSNCNILPEGKCYCDSRCSDCDSRCSDCEHILDAFRDGDDAVFNLLECEYNNMTKETDDEG